jgi:DNA-binding MarR family transcriptional regulator
MIKMTQLISIDNLQAEHLSEAILELDQTVQRLVRAGWPTTWLNGKLPLGATRVLLVIEAGRATTPGSVADVLGVGRTTVTGLLDRLEADGLLTRSIDPNDKRSFVLQLTDKGREVARQVENVRRVQVAQALAKMGQTELVALHTGLSALVEAMHAENPEESQII